MRLKDFLNVSNNSDYEIICQWIEGSLYQSNLDSCNCQNRHYWINRKVIYYNKIWLIISYVKPQNLFTLFSLWNHLLLHSSEIYQSNRDSCSYRVAIIEQTEKQINTTNNYSPVSDHKYIQCILIMKSFVRAYKVDSTQAI